jgi:hypothetical protein
MTMMLGTAGKVAATFIVAAATAGVSSGPSSADPPKGHQVTYRVTAASERFTHIAFMANQPSNQLDYAENSPK